MRTTNRGFGKVLVLLLAVVLLLGSTIGGTLAYLQMKTSDVVNTFTTSDVSITLTETQPENRTAKMVPGAAIAKDPKVSVGAGSEDCYVYVKIAKSDNFDTYMSYEAAEGWTEVETGDGYVVIGRTAKAGDEFKILKGDEVQVKASVTKDQMTLANANNPTLTFTAYAIQSANLKDGDTAINDVTAAWALAKTSTVPAN